MKKQYETPVAEQLEFEYSDIVTASNDNPVHHGDKGHGVSQTDVGCNIVPGHDNAN